MTRWIQFAGLVQAAIIAGNFLLPRRLDLRANLARLPIFLRQVFLVHWLYILLVLAGFSVLCFGFADDLAGGSTLGRFISGGIALFWLLRFFLQILYYDAELRRRNRLLDVAYCAAVVFLASVFGAAAFAP
jgi:hypothetical protein